MPTSQRPATNSKSQGGMQQIQISYKAVRSGDISVKQFLKFFHS